MFFEQITTPGLGCFSYLVGSPSDGIAAVVDPRRDIDIYSNIAEDNDMRITHIFETHVHADHVSGALDLRALTGADIYIHERAPVCYESKPLKDGDEFILGSVAVRVLYTPGHTPDSVSFIVSDLTRSLAPEMILTGDLLFVGDVGRPDLPGEDIIDEQIENLYNSLYNTLHLLPDHPEVYPAHGQGSLCGQSMSSKPYSTLGYERIANPMLNFTDFTEFKRAVLSNLPMRPQSFSAIIEANLNCVESPPERGFTEYALSPDKAERLRAAGAVILDLRSAASFSAAHIPGSINVDFTGGPVLNWIGVAVEQGSPLVLVLSSDDDFEDTLTQLRRIGYDTVKGWLMGGVDAWAASGKETQNLPHLSASDLRARLAGPNPPALIDVRSPGEFKQMKIEGSINLPINSIAEYDVCPVDPESDTVVICLSGFRAGIAASMLQSRGCKNISLLSGGVTAWE